ncbi:hypothetical protein A2U01_0002781, partial [Trifolium medium]|nr:hypothetical protein [Trifolium medium]
MVNLAAALEKDGISAFRFDFAGNGESEGSFQYGNYYREVEDLRAIVQHFREKKYVITAIVGHSKVSGESVVFRRFAGNVAFCRFVGGNVVLLYASKFKDIDTVVNISGRFNLAR